ncbi:MAG: glycerophosphodiester phosphodiesterase family protein [Actinomycetaceae bacterium]|nr:glycerophosphodiester phosphodiesterase family protein [Actinomycetaceae bacterium]
MAALRLFAHRGLSARAPENTIAALEVAARAGAEWVEIDADISADGVVFLCHDATLERTTNGSGPIADKTWAELARLDAGAWKSPRFAGERLPLLSEVVEWASRRGVGLNVELKSPLGGARQARRLVDAACEILGDACCGVLVSSFNHLMLARAGRKTSHPLACLFEAGELREDWRTRVELVGARAIHPAWEDLTPHRLERMRAFGYDVNVWTVNCAEKARELARWGASGIFCDDVEAMAASLGVTKDALLD